MNALTKHSPIIFSITLLLSCNSLAPDPGNDKTSIDETIRSDDSLYVITGVNLLALDVRTEDGITNNFYTDTLRTRFRLDIYAESFLIHSKDLDDYSEGFSPLGLVVNSPDYSTERGLRFNKAVIYKGQTIEAYDNILDYQESISDPSIFFPPFLTPYAIHSIILDVNDFEFENGPYEVFAEWNSRGGQHFADTLSLLLEFE